MNVLSIVPAVWAKLSAFERAQKVQIHIQSIEARPSYPFAHSSLSRQAVRSSSSQLAANESRLQHLFRIVIL